jgi:hypothetical protein
MGVTGAGSGLAIAREARTLNAATWAAGEITFTTTAAHGLAVGARIRVANITTAAYNGVYTTITGTTASTVKVAKTADPGTVTLGTDPQLFSVGMTTLPGTAGTRSRVLQMLSESLDLDVAKNEAESLANSLLIQQATAVRQGRRRVSGSTALQLFDHGETLLFEAMLGQIVTTGSNPYTHTASPSRSLPSYTIQTTFGAVTDALLKQSVGCVVDSFEIALVAGENATLGVDWVGLDQALTTASALAGTAGSSLLIYGYVDGTVTVAGASPGCVKRITINGNNNLASDELCIGRTTIQDPERNGFLEITGEIEFELEPNDIGYIADYIAGTQKTVVLYLTRGTNKDVTITFTMQWQTGITPKVSGVEKLTVTGPYKAYVTSGNTDAQTFSIVALNADATP